MDRAWFYASYSAQDIRLVRRAGALVDRTQLKNPSVKVNWQADKKDMVSFLFFNGSKIKDYRSPGTSGITLDAPTPPIEAAADKNGGAGASRDRMRRAQSRRESTVPRRPRSVPRRASGRMRSRAGHADPRWEK